MLGAGGMELNPVVVEAAKIGAAELLKLGIIVWLLTFSALLWATGRRSIIPAVTATVMLFVGIVGTLSNLRAMS